MKFLWWLAKPLYFFVRSKTTVSDMAAHLGLDKDLPVLYVLPKKSFVDLLVLYHHCLKLGLPKPLVEIDQLHEKKGASYLYLSKPGLLMTRSESAPVPPLVRQIKNIEDVPQADIQVVPVSILWGKNPGREENSFFRLLFNDDENAGMLQKFFIVLAQGRNTLLHMGKPISLRRLVDEKSPTDQTAKKLRRVLRVHFRTQRNSILGQKLYIRDGIIDRLLMTKAVQKAIKEEGAKKRSSERKARKMARRYAKEICADQTYSVVRTLELIFSKLWNKIYNGVEIKGIERIREYADKNYEIVYVPNHRSHLDYLLINYSIYASGLPAPHTAAGVNLNFWPIGGILRRGGAFFMKRRFAGNRLYSAVFSEYLQYLLNKGYPVAFFPEGGRSRTGRLLDLKTGLLSMVVHGFMREPERPIVFFPVYVGYDKVVEVGSYLKELSGKSKRRESVLSVFKSLNILKQYWGKAYISVGEPLELRGFLEEHKPGWEADQTVQESRPDWLSPLSRHLARGIGERINGAATISSSSLVSFALLSAVHRAMPQEELLGLTDCLLELGRQLNTSYSFPEVDSRQLLDDAARLDGIRRFSHPGGDVLYFNELDTIVNSYYKNNILHVYTIPALMACFFHHGDTIEEEELMEGCRVIYPFLKDELYLPFDETSVLNELSRVLDILLQMGLVRRKGDKLARPLLSSAEHGYLDSLGRSLLLVIERYAIIAALLAKGCEKGYVDLEEFQSQCQKMAQRLAILNGMANPDAADKSLFQNHLSLLKRMGYLVAHDDSGRLRVDGRIEEVFEKTKMLLSLDTRHSIERLSVKEV